jgi:predicted transcriptional regulator
VIAIWDNFMNIMDLSRSVFLSVSDPALRRSLDSDYQRGKERAKRKATYKLCSDDTMSILSEKGQLTLTDDYKLTMNEINESNGNKIIMDNIDWVIPIMLRQRLIQIDGKIINLTLRGEKRFKRTTKFNREKWRRELSNISCSWIAKT